MAIDSMTLGTELDTLTRKLGQLLRNAGAHRGGFDARHTGGALAAAIETLDIRAGDANLQLERLIGTRPIIATVSLFALGMAFASY